jgi:hypothetical protein
MPLHCGYTSAAVTLMGGEKCPAVVHELSTDRIHLHGHLPQSPPTGNVVQFHFLHALSVPARVRIPNAKGFPPRAHRCGENTAAHVATSQPPVYNKASHGYRTDDQASPGHGQVSGFESERTAPTVYCPAGDRDHLTREVDVIGATGGVADG